MRQSRAKYSKMNWWDQSDIVVSCWAVGVGIAACGIGLWYWAWEPYYTGIISTAIGVVKIWKTGILDNPSLVLP